MRDMGGYRCGSNSYVKYGMFYRGTALDESISMIDDAAENVFRYLGIKTEIDLRGDIPHTCTGWDKNNTNVFCISGIGYEPLVTVCDERRKQFRTVFEAMAEEENYLENYIGVSRSVPEKIQSIAVEEKPI